MTVSYSGDSPSCLGAASGAGAQAPLHELAVSQIGVTHGSALGGERVQSKSRGQALSLTFPSAEAGAEWWAWGGPGTPPPAGKGLCTGGLPGRAGGSAWDRRRAFIWLRGSELYMKRLGKAASASQNHSLKGLLEWKLQGPQGKVQTPLHPCVLSVKSPCTMTCVHAERDPQRPPPSVTLSSSVREYWGSASLDLDREEPPWTLSAPNACPGCGEGTPPQALVQQPGPGPQPKLRPVW